MMCKDLLLQSLSTIRTKFPSYYDKLKNDFSNIDYDDIDLFLEKSFPSKQRAFFTISSKESFNDLISDSLFQPDDTAGTITGNIENAQGAELPETGGIGTTLFYVGGGAITAVAGVILVVRRRVKKEK